MSTDSNDSAFYDEIREWLHSIRYSMDEFGEQDRAKVLNTYMQTVKLALSLAVPIEFSDLVASMSWLAGEFALRKSDILPRVPDYTFEGITVFRVCDKTPPGTILSSKSDDELIQMGPISNYVNYLREAVSYFDDSLGKDHCPALQKSPKDYEKEYSGERLINHPAAVANRIRNKIIELSEKFKKTDGEVNILAGDFISEVLIRSAGYAISLHAQRNGNAQELTSLAINWLIAGFVTMPGPNTQLDTVT